MFEKVLIANRGEIALRIMQTCREMGIQTVAVYSQADRLARHVLEADESYEIGPAPANESYLRIEKIIEVALLSGAAAVHPGYGFLSENPRFARACVEAGITFIGPSASVMERMGSKIQAKELAQHVGVPTVPGYNGQSQKADHLVREAERLGYPLLIKASAGGGGKGMRVVDQKEQFLEQLAGAQREAQASFADSTVFLERYIRRPRHIEIQILSDQFGNVIHLGERECSLQRRHQKILEESPSVALTPELRAQMGEAAVRLARAADYVNAGTMEFMLDDEGNFYFLEMNTRLQVEHPVTELVTGLDLVRHQLLIAAGEPLTIQQGQISPRGHAIEVRLYAEDPAQNFLPSTGTIEQFFIPKGAGIRLDSGVDSGDVVSPYYDPMLAKLIVYGENRASAIARLQATIERSAILGVTSNLSLLEKICQNTAFRAGKTHTDFLSEQNLLTPVQEEEPPYEMLCAAAYNDLSPEQTSEEKNPWHRRSSWQLSGTVRVLTYNWQGIAYTIRVSPPMGEQKRWRFEMPDRTIEERTCQRRGAEVMLRKGESQQRFLVQRTETTTLVHDDQHHYLLTRRQPPDISQATHGNPDGQTKKSLHSPMAGTVVKIHVQAGEEVQAHQTLLILSAMKMEHAITAPAIGRVRHVYPIEGQVVAGGVTLIEME